MTSSVTSFNGNALNSGAFVAYLLGSDTPFAREVAPVIVRPTGYYPMATRFEYKERTIPVRVNIVSGTLFTELDILSQWFAPGTIGPLVVSVEGVSRALDCMVTKIIPYDGSANAFTAVLLATDPRWRSSTQHVSSTAAVANPTAITVTPVSGGATEDKAVIKITPTSNKAAANSQLYLEEIVVANVLGSPFPSYAIDVTGGGWNHAAEVTAVRSLASGNDVRVRVDGVEVPRWAQADGTHNFNKAATRIWANITLSAMKGAVLLANITNVAPANGADLEVVSGGTIGWPASGALLIDDEAFLYTGVTEDNANHRAAFQGITRAARGTTAANHSAGTPGTPNVYWIEHRVQVVHGWTGAGAPDAHNEQMPMLDLSDTALANTNHIWNGANSPSGFAHSSQPRSMQWSRALDSGRDPLEAQYVMATEAVAALIAAMNCPFLSGGPVATKPNFNEWVRDVPSGTNGAPTYTLSVDASMAVRSLTIDADGNEVIRENKQGTFASGTWTPSVGSTGYQELLWAFAQVIAQTPGWGGGTGLGTLAGGGAAVFGQQFLTGSRPLTLTNIAVKYSDAGTPRTVTVFLMADASNVPSGQIASATFVTNGLTTPAIGTVGISATLQPGTRYWVTFDEGHSEVTMYGFAGAYTGGPARISSTNDASKSFAVQMLGYQAPLAASLERMDSLALATNNDAVNVTKAVIPLATAGVPYVKMQARQGAYWLNGVLTNSTTGQSLTFDLICAVNDVITVDVGARSVTNTTTGQRVDFAAAFSDPDLWFSLIAGANTLSWAEAGIVAETVEIDFYDRWDL